MLLLHSIFFNLSEGQKVNTLHVDISRIDVDDVVVDYDDCDYDYYDGRSSTRQLERQKRKKKSTCTIHKHYCKHH